MHARRIALLLVSRAPCPVDNRLLAPPIQRHPQPHKSNWKKKGSQNIISDIVEWQESRQLSLSLFPSPPPPPLQPPLHPSSLALFLSFLFFLFLSSFFHSFILSFSFFKFIYFPPSSALWILYSHSHSHSPSSYIFPFTFFYIPGNDCSENSLFLSLGIGQARWAYREVGIYQARQQPSRVNLPSQSKCNLGNCFQKPHTEAT